MFIERRRRALYHLTELAVLFTSRNSLQEEYGTSKRTQSRVSTMIPGSFRQHIIFEDRNFPVQCNNSTVVKARTAYETYFRTRELLQYNTNCPERQASSVAAA